MVSAESSSKIGHRLHSLHLNLDLDALDASLSSVYLDARACARQEIQA